MQGPCRTGEDVTSKEITPLRIWSVQLWSNWVFWFSWAMLCIIFWMIKHDTPRWEELWLWNSQELWPLDCLRRHSRAYAFARLGALYGFTSVMNTQLRVSIVGGRGKERRSRTYCCINYVHHGDVQPCRWGNESKNESEKDADQYIGPLGIFRWPWRSEELSSLGISFALES